MLLYTASTMKQLAWLNHPFHANSGFPAMYATTNKINKFVCADYAFCVKLG